MAKKPVVRFAVETGGVLRKLISIREVSNGRLIVNTDTGQNCTNFNGAHARLLSTKHTIHPSERSATNANQIHHTTIFEDGRKGEDHLLTHAIRDHRYQPLYFRRIGATLGTLKENDRDCVYNLGPYDPKNYTLLISLFVTSPQGAFSFPMSLQYGVRTALFTRFSLIVAYSFVRRPTCRTTAIRSYSSVSPGMLTDAQLALRNKDGITAGGPAKNVRNDILYEFEQVLSTVDADWLTLLVRPHLRKPSGAISFIAKPEQ